MDESEKKKEFLHSFDFMKLGQAVNSNNKQAAVMIARRMEKAANEADLPNFARLISGIRMAMMSGSKSEALNIMTQLTNQRVRLINAENADVK